MTRLALALLLVVSAAAAMAESTKPPFRRTRLTLDAPLSVLGFVGLSVHHVGTLVGIRGSYHHSFAGSLVTASQLATLAVPAYFRPNGTGVFIEPGLAVFKDSDQSQAYVSGRATIGWEAVTQRGLVFRSAIGIGRRFGERTLGDGETAAHDLSIFSELLYPILEVGVGYGF